MTSARTIKLRLKSKAPRNPLVALARQRKAGSHSKSYKSKRLEEKRALQKQLEV